ncbi:MAG TPA: sigma-70 family RNA polymerase sigma factor [Anaeromyxobacteraceae bacterium]|nr:sigma-70 family RNA polymerase sigma factor [Anaeromyxobacteraceae bacterium]
MTYDPTPFRRAAEKLAAEIDAASAHREDYLRHTLIQRESLDAAANEEDPALTPEAALFAAEENHRVLDALERLPELERWVLTLAVLEGLSTREVMERGAAERGLRRGLTTWARIEKRAKQRLRRLVCDA